ncbi:hypothetical protein BDZ97DRAFT_1226986 [Flammula alnicola]|nr:hypothetical protein BDZ97DRAFT_1226986 [Flammula alnicola]
MWSSLLLTPVLFASVLAANDWSKPCFSGVCQYDLPTTNGSASGTVKIWGSNAAISDITPAAGWEIIDCSPDALEQNIRLVCKAGGSSDCANLHSNSKNGAVGKLVRLPENCGKSAFAVVTRAYLPQDQSIPSNVSSALARRAGSNTTVQGLQLSTNFSSVDTSSTGPINFAIRAANVPGANGDLVTSSQQQRRSNSRVFQRGVFDFVTNALNDISSLNDFNVNNSQALPPLDVNKTFTLVDQSVSCPPVDVSVKIDVDTKAHAVVTLGLAASGTIVPPKVSDFAIIANLNAEIDGTVDIAADAAGTLDSGKIPLFQVGIPGLDFPGILTIGPSFQINAQATATLDVNVGLTVGINYKIDGAELVFPPNRNKSSGGGFNIGDTPLKLSASPSVTATGTVAAHLIPSLNLGISALGGIVDASVFLELDASASMTLTAQGQVNASATIANVTSAASRKGRAVHDSPESLSVMRRGQHLPGRHFWNPPPLAIRTSQSDDPADNSTAATASTNSTGTAVTTVIPDSASNVDTSATSTASTTKTLAVSTNTTASFGGCFEIDAGLDVNVGADGNFFGLFDASTKVALFSQKFELFKKCFGSIAARRSLPEIAPRRPLPLSLNSRSLLSVIPQKRAFELTCPAANANSNAGQQGIANETIPASSIQQV